MADRTGADRPNGRAAGRRLPYHLCLVALDFPDQRTDRHYRHSRCRAYPARHRGRRSAQDRLARFPSGSRCSVRNRVRAVSHQPAGASARIRCHGSGRRRNSRYRLPFPCTPDPASASRSRPVFEPRICVVDLWRFLLPGGNRGDAVSAAADVSATVRADPVSVRPAHFRHGFWRYRHEVHCQRHIAARRLPHGDDRKCCARRPVDRRQCALHLRHALCGDRRHPVRGRACALAVFHQHQCACVCRALRQGCGSGNRHRLGQPADQHRTRGCGCRRIAGGGPGGDRLRARPDRLRRRIRDRSNRFRALGALFRAPAGKYRKSGPIHRARQAA